MTQNAFTPRPGLCSVTFRQLGCEEVVALAKRAGLEAIEWGTDVHLPPDDLEHARRIKELCNTEGLATHTLGSYLRCNDGDEAELNAVVELAVVIGARRVRVWAGEQGSDVVNKQDRSRVADNLVRYCAAAETAGITVALEHHPDTLTDTATSSAALLLQVNHPALFTYWQPTPELSIADALEQIEQLRQWLCDLHVFHWVADKQRRPLAEGRDFWQSVFSNIHKAQAPGDNAPFYAFLEFVKADDPEQCIKDAVALKSLCSQGTRNIS